MADTIHADEYEALCILARELNEWVPPERVCVPAAAAPSDARGDRPGDQFNRRAAWGEILERHGWKVDRTSGDVTYWTRPGKSRGVSATSGKCSTEGSGDLLYVFSANAHPFDMDAAYSKFAALALLDHGGDFEKAAADLKRQGYGRDDPTVAFASGAVPDDGVAPDPDFATNDDLKKYDLGVKWLWERWLQRATVNLLAAEGGLGKTRFILDLCRRVHLGLPWPDGTPTEAWPHKYLAMWVAGDRNHGELLENSEKFGFYDRISYSGSKLDPLGGVTLNSPADFKTLYRRAKAARPMFLVVDTLGGATALNVSKQEEARTFFAPLSDLAVRLNLCVVVITHLNAGKGVLGKRAEERVRTLIRMTAENKAPETVRRIEIIKSNSLFPEPLGMTLGDTGCEYTTDAPPPPRAFGEPAGDDAGAAEKGPPTKVRECMEWLEDKLAAAPARVSALRTEAETTRGFTATVLYKAKKALNLIEAESQGYKWWGLKDSAGNIA